MLESRGGVAGQPVPEGGAAGNPRGFGKIINVSSLVAFQGKCGFTAFRRTAPHPSPHFARFLRAPLGYSVSCLLRDLPIVALLITFH